MTISGEKEKKKKKKKKRTTSKVRKNDMICESEIKNSHY